MPNFVEYIYFNVAEYFLYLINLGVIFGVVWYYNVTVREKYNSVYGFLFGGKNISVLSISLALTASHLTSITLLGVPVEIYLRGTQYLTSSSLALIIVTCLTAVIYLPVFYNLQLSSSFEYLEIRFSASIRCLAAVLFIVSKLMILAIIPYVPIMAFRQDASHQKEDLGPRSADTDTLLMIQAVSAVRRNEIGYIRSGKRFGVPKSTLERYFCYYRILLTNVVAAKASAVICIICATLTAMAGLRAVVAIGIGTSVLAVVGTAMPSGLGIFHIGFNKTWESANSSGRLVFYDPDPEFFNHTSFFFVTLALSTNWLWKVAISQQSIQKLLAVNTINKARLCLVLSCAGVILMKLLSCFLGLVVYAWFEGWDPLTSKTIRKGEELVPHFLSKLSKTFPGICAVFILAIFTATTGCIASTINSVSGVIFEEFTRSLLPKNTNELACCKIMKGAISGFIVSLLVCNLLLISAKYSLVTRPLTFEGKPLAVHGHRNTFNNETQTLTTAMPATHQPLFKIAFTYCPFIGALLVLLVGLPMSYFTGNSKTNLINPDVFCPLTQNFLPKSQTRSLTSSSSSETRSSVREATENLNETLQRFKESL